MAASVGKKGDAFKNKFLNRCEEQLWKMWSIHRLKSTWNSALNFLWNAVPFFRTIESTCQCLYEIYFLVLFKLRDEIGSLQVLLKPIFWQKFYFLNMLEIYLQDLLILKVS